METAINLNTDIESKALAIPDQARSILVIDNDSMEQANTFNLDIRQSIKDIQDWFEPLVTKAHQAHKALTVKRAETLKPLEEASAYVTGQVKAYLRKVKEEEEREAERLRLEAQKQAEEEQLARAAEAEASGNVEEANEILEAEPIFVAPVPQMNIPKVDNRLYRVQTKVKVKDRWQFLEYVDSNVLLECLNESAWQTIENGLSRKAKALGKAFKMPGCAVTES